MCTGACINVASVPRCVCCVCVCSGGRLARGGEGEARDFCLFIWNGFKPPRAEFDQSREVSVCPRGDAQSLTGPQPQPDRGCGGGSN